MQKPIFNEKLQFSSTRNGIFRGALEGVPFLNLRNGLKGVLFLIQVFLIRGEGGVMLHDVRRQCHHGRLPTNSASRVWNSH